MAKYIFTYNLLKNKKQTINLLEQYKIFERHLK